MCGDTEIRVGDAAVFGVVQSFHLFFRGNAQSDGLVDELEHDQGRDKGPHKTGGNAQELYTDDDLQMSRRC